MANDANPDLEDKETHTPLVRAAMQGQTDVVERLLQEHPGKQTLTAALSAAFAAEQYEVAGIIHAAGGVPPAQARDKSIWRCPICFQPLIDQWGDHEHIFYVIDPEYYPGSIHKGFFWGDVVDLYLLLCDNRKAIKGGISTAPPVVRSLWKKVTPSSSMIIEEDDENHAARDVHQIHRLLLALMEEGAELGLTDEARELVVGAEVGGRQGSEGGRVEARLLANGSDELPGAIDEHRAAGIAVVQELLERSHDRSEVIFGK